MLTHSYTTIHFIGAKNKMSIGIALTYGYQQTCDFCVAVRNVLTSVGKSTISFFESVGRARAANQLSQMGYHAEAKALMLGDNND
jgi:predicted DCC family thiol-disulfide oxidoreductase YuxK